MWFVVMEAAASGSDPVWTNLVAYYPLDGTATDSITSSNGTWGADVTETNDVPFASAGTAASMNQAANSYVSTLGSALLNGESDCTIAAWIKLRTLESYAGLVASRGINLNGFMQKESTKAGQIYGSISSILVPVFGAASTESLTVGTWGHVAIVKDSSSTNMSVCINGILADSAYSSGTILQNDIFKIGYEDAVTGRKTDGTFDEVPIWNRALSSNEVFRIYDEQLTYP